MRELIGSICIAGSGILLVWQNKKRNRKRSEILADMAIALIHIADRVRLTRIPLPDLLENLAEESRRDVSAFFDQVAEAANRGEHVFLAWKAAAEKLPIPQAEQMIISEAGNCLCKDEEGLCKGLERASDTLEKYRERWERNRAECEKRTSALYLSGAAFIIILLI